MARTHHSRPYVNGARRRKSLEDFTQTRQPRPALRRRATRTAIVLAELKGI